jgi:type I restriction enzyme S subunit
MQTVFQDDSATLSGWTDSTIGDTCEPPQYGFTASATTAPIGPRMLRITDIQDGKVDWAAVPYCDCEREDCERYALKRGDILVARIGATTGKTFIVADCPKSVFASYLIRVRPRAGVVPAFLFFYMNSREYWQQVNRDKHDKLKGGINAMVLRALRHPVPPLAEQRAIAVVLGKLQAAAAAQQAIIDRTAELKAALMAKLFTQGTRGGPTQQTRFGCVPSRWTIKTLEDCAIVQTGVAKGRRLNGGAVVDVPYLRVANVQDGHLDLRKIKTIELREGELPRYCLRADDVVLTEGGDFDKLGRGFIWNGQIDPCVHQNHVFAVRVDRSRLLPEYVAYFCQSPYGKSYFLNVAHKTTNLACINTAKLRALPVPIPDLVEQREIADSLNAVQATLDAATRRRELQSELFDAMLDELMTGRIRVDGLGLAGAGVIPIA